MKYIVCFSGGHSSAIAAIETVRQHGYHNVILLNHDICPRVEHADIKRFKQQVAHYLGLPITYANMEGWKNKDQFDVCMEAGAFSLGIQSMALCTNRLKTEPFERYLADNFPPNGDCTIVYGFDESELQRIQRRSQILGAKGYKTSFPLATTPRTIWKTENVGILRPVTYELYKHANCIGCLKAGKQHWFCVTCTAPTYGLKQSMQRKKSVTVF